MKKEPLDYIVTFRTTKSFAARIRRKAAADDRSVAYYLRRLAEKDMGLERAHDALKPTSEPAS